MITTSTDLPIYTLKLFNGTQASLISTALHVSEVQDSVAWAKGSIFKNDSIERIGQSLDTVEKSKLTLPSVYIPLPFPLQLLPSYWMVGNMRCLKATMKDLTSFCRHSIWQYQLLNSQLLDPFQPAKPRFHQEYMYLQVCGPRVWRWPRLRQIWITWLAGTLTWFENPPFAKDMQYIGLIYHLYHLSYTWWDIRRVNWPSPRRLFLLAPRLPEVSGIVQRPTVISDEVGCVPTFPDAMEIEWVLKKMDLFSTNVEENPLQVWSPRWSAVTGLNSALIAMVSGLGMRFPDKDMYKRDRCSGYFFHLFQSWTCRVGNCLKKEILENGGK